MTKRPFILRCLLIGTALIIAACSSADQTAAANASAAEAALNAGDPRTAQQFIRRALAARDDVGEYWLIAAHVGVALGDNIGAFDAYRNVLASDRGNLEALSALCQLALVRNTPSQAAEFAEQLALLQPDDLLPPTVRAGMAMMRGDSAKSEAILNDILAKNPDFVPGLILKSKLMISLDRHGDAAKTLEESLKAPGDPDARLFALKDLYLKAGDRANFRNSVVRLAEAKPNEPQRQLDLADLLYDEGQRDAAYAITRRIARLRPDDIGLASTILSLWLKHPDTVPVDAIARDAAGLPSVMRAAYAQYANEIQRPDIAVAVLGPSTTTGAPQPGNSDAKAAYAYAIGMQGQVAAALAQLNAILKIDPTQPRALIARARLNTDLGAAVEDARRVVSDDPDNVTARLVLAALFLKQNDAVLAESTLRAGANAANGDPRAVARLVQLLQAQGRTDSARTAITDFRRANPFRLGGKKPPEPPQENRKASA